MNTHTQTHTRLIDTYSSIYFKMHSPASQPTYTWYGGAGGPGYRPVEDRGRQSRSLRWSSWSWERDRFCRESNMAKRHTQMSKKNSVKGSWTLCSFQLHKTSPMTWSSQSLLRQTRGDLTCLNNTSDKPVWTQHQSWCTYKLCFLIILNLQYLCDPLPTGVPPGPIGGRAPTGVIVIAPGVPIGMGLIGMPLCRISAEERNHKTIH